MAEHRAAAERDGIELRHGAAVETCCAPTTAPVTGVAVRAADGAREILGARAVVLAAGGFEANPQMRAADLGPNWAWRRRRHASQHRRGPAGGARARRPGVRARSGPPRDPVGRGRAADRATASWTNRSLAAVLSRRRSWSTLDGERFIDEGADFRNYTYAKFGAEVLRQPQGIAAQISTPARVQMLRIDRLRGTRGHAGGDAGTLGELADGPASTPRARGAPSRSSTPSTAER